MFMKLMAEEFAEDNDKLTIGLFVKSIVLLYQVFINKGQKNGKKCRYSTNRSLHINSGS